MQNQDKSATWLLLLAALSFLPTLFFYLVGEEGIYVITAMETWQHPGWMQEIMYGVDDGRPPLINWLTMPLAALIGWSHVVIAVRLVAVSATLGAVAWLYWLCNRLWGDKSFALFASLTALSLADLLLYRGWLSYTDPVFAFFTFGAMATLWVAAVERRRDWLMLSVVLVSCAMITKAFTTYVFYATTVLVLFLKEKDTRRFFLSPPVWLIFAFALAFPWVWLSTVPRHETGTFMFEEILRKLAIRDLPAYLENLVMYPVEMFVRLSPAALLAAYLLSRKRVTLSEAAPQHFSAAVFIAGLCFIPYWLSPQNSVRYLLPIYPVVALVCARIIWRSGDAGRKLALHWFAGIIAVKFLFALVLFPYYQTHYRGKNYEQAAQAIIKRTQGFPLYINDARAVALSIAGYIDIKRFPQPPLTMPPESFDSGFILSMDAKSKLGEVIESYTLAADRIYLLCRGMACAAVPRNED